MQRHRCQVNSIDQFFVCQEEQCYANSVSCEECFNYQHTSHVDGKKTLHQRIPFSQTPMNFSLRRLAQIQELLNQKIKTSLSGFETNYQNVATFGLSQSQLFLELFEGDQKLNNEYFMLRQVYQGREATFFSPPSQQFCSKLKAMTEAKYNSICQSLQGASKEHNFIQMQLNILSGGHAERLENAMVIQQQYFVSYCQQLVQNKESFNVFKYLEQRKKDQSNLYDAIYMSREFEDFLIQKYQKNASEKGIFEVNEYINGFWKYYIYALKRDPNLQSYFHYELESYQLYHTYMKEYDIEQSLLGFKSWKLVNRPSLQALNMFTNQYFHDSYILALINLKIQKFAREKKELAIDVIDFGKYLKEFCDLNTEGIDLNVYQSYFTFMGDNESFLKHIQKSSEIVFNHQWAVEYLYQVFKTSTKPALKKYKQYQEQKQINEKSKLQENKHAIESLKEQMMNDEGEGFYEYVFSNFLVYSQEKERPLTPEEYYAYKKVVMSEYDEKYIRLQDEKYKEAMQAYENEQNEEGMAQNKEIDQQEQQLVREYQPNQYNSEDEEDQLKLCLCCNGNPYNCPQEQCKVMGCCVSCMLN